MSLCSIIQPNLEEVLSKSKTVFTIRDKLSGKTCGYALMLTDTVISLDQSQSQLLPCQLPGQAHEEVQANRRDGAISESRDLALRSLAFDLDISEDSSLNTTVEDGLPVSEQGTREVVENMDVTILSISRGDDENNDITEADNNKVDDDSKFSAIFSSNNVNSAPQVSFMGSSSKSPAKTTAADMASKIVVVKDSDGKIVAHKSAVVPEKNMSHPSYIKDALESKSVQKPTIKRKQDGKGKFLPGVNSAFYTDVGVTQPEVKRYKKFRLVRCLLCKDEKIVAIASFGGHLRSYHEPPVKCDICEKEFTSGNMRRHMKICNTRKDKSPELSTEDLRLSEDQLKLESKKVEFMLVSAMRPGINVKVVLRRNDKIRRAMKKFGKQCKVSWKKLKFVLEEEELTGGEQVSDLEGRNIVVYGKFN